MWYINGKQLHYKLHVSVRQELGTCIACFWRKHNAHEEQPVLMASIIEGKMISCTWGLNVRFTFPFNVEKRNKINLKINLWSHKFRI